MDSQIGSLYLVASERGLQGIFFKKQAVPMAKSLKGPALEIQILRRAIRELAEYFSGKRKKFELPIDIEGTPFQKSVWKALAQIPYGTTCSYRKVAESIKNVKAVRAVGTANGKNPVCILIPCHRVIASNGTIGGYSGGLVKKRKLLALEQFFNKAEV